MVKPAVSAERTVFSGRQAADLYGRRDARRYLFRHALSVLLALPVLAPGLLEGGLRLVGFGGCPPILGQEGQTEKGALVISDPAGAGAYFFANRQHPGHNEQHCFYQPKGTNAVRIFIGGESAAKGFPKPRNLTALAFLGERLRDALVQRREFTVKEVLMLGGKFLRRDAARSGTCFKWRLRVCLKLPLEAVDSTAYSCGSWTAIFRIACHHQHHVPTKRLAIRASYLIVWKMKQTTDDLRAHEPHVWFTNLPSNICGWAPAPAAAAAAAAVPPGPLPCLLAPRSPENW